MEKIRAHVIAAFLCGSVCHAFNVGNVVASHQGAPGVSFTVFNHKNYGQVCPNFKEVLSPCLAMQ